MATFIFGIPLYFSLSLFLESKSLSQIHWRLGKFIIGVIVLTVYHYVVLLDDTKTFYLRILQVNLAIYLLVSFIAFLNLNKENGFWQLNKNFFLRFLNSLLYSSFFFVGTAIALLTISKLFSVEIGGESYFQLWVVSVCLLQVWHFLAGVPKNISDLEKDKSYPKELRFFVQYLLIPLITLYTAILYIYMARIVLTWDWPRGYVGWLVSIMSVLGIFNLLLLDPEKDKKESRWIVAYAKYYYILLLPLLVMLFVAIGKRISEYGVTEKRYFLVALGLLLTSLSIYFIFSKKKNIKWIPISLFLVTVLSLVGPLSAYRISLKSQYSRAEHLLTSHGLLVSGTEKKTTASVSRKVEKQLSSIFDYIIQNHGYSNIQHWFPNKVIDKVSGASLKPRQQKSTALMEYLGLEYISGHYNRANRAHFNYRSSLENVPLNISEFNFVAYFSGSTESKIKFNDKELNLRLDKQDAFIELTEPGNKTVKFSLQGIAEKIKFIKKKKKQVSNELMLIKGDGQYSDIFFFVNSMKVNLNGDDTTITHISGLLLFK